MNGQDQGREPYYVYITPPQASKIAHEFNTRADKARALADQMSRIDSALEASWLGNAANLFLEDYKTKIASMRSFASHLDGLASEIRSFKVRVKKWRSV